VGHSDAFERCEFVVGDLVPVVSACISENVGAGFEAELVGVTKSHVSFGRDTRERMSTERARKSVAAGLFEVELVVIRSDDGGTHEKLIGIGQPFITRLVEAISCAYATWLKSSALYTRLNLSSANQNSSNTPLCTLSPSSSNWSYVITMCQGRARGPENASFPACCFSQSLSSTRSEVEVSFERFKSICWDVAGGTRMTLLDSTFEPTDMRSRVGCAATSEGLSWLCAAMPNTGTSVKMREYARHFIYANVNAKIEPEGLLLARLIVTRFSLASTKV